MRLSLGNTGEKFFQILERFLHEFWIDFSEILKRFFQDSSRVPSRTFRSPGVIFIKSWRGSIQNPWDFSYEVLEIFRSDSWIDCGNSFRNLREVPSGSWKDFHEFLEISHTEFMSYFLRNTKEIPSFILEVFRSLILKEIASGILEIFSLENWRDLFRNPSVVISGFFLRLRLLFWDWAIPSKS